MRIDIGREQDAGTAAHRDREAQRGVAEDHEAPGGTVVVTPGAQR